MEHTERKPKEFIAYEYKEITAEKNEISFLMDGYECFGWELDENIQGNSSGMYESAYLPRSARVVIRLKRNRKIINKMELTRLQRNFEACVREIKMLENKKTSKGTMYSLIVGLIGTAFMAGSVFAITAPVPNILLCIILAIPAFIGWVCPYFIYKKATSQETERINPLIEEKFDEIYEICEKGNKLLY